MDYSPARTRKSSPCREVAVVERWPLVENVIIRRRTRWPLVENLIRRTRTRTRRTRRRRRIIVLSL